MKPIYFLTAAFVITSNMAFAAVTADTIAADLKAQGFTRVEIRERANQFKAEAYRGNEKFEAVYDKASGDELNTRTRENGRDDDAEGDDDRKGKGSSRDGRDDDSRDDRGDHDRGERGGDHGGDHDGGDHDGGDHDGGDSDGGDRD